MSCGPSVVYSQRRAGPARGSRGRQIARRRALVAYRCSGAGRAHPRKSPGPERRRVSSDWTISSSRPSVLEPPALVMPGVSGLRGEATTWLDAYLGSDVTAAHCRGAARARRGRGGVVRNGGAEKHPPRRYLKARVSQCIFVKAPSRGPRRSSQSPVFCRGCDTSGVGRHERQPRPRGERPASPLTTRSIIEVRPGRPGDAGDLGDLLLGEAPGLPELLDVLREP